jgi:hypothetical protein
VTIGKFAKIPTRAASAQGLHATDFRVLIAVASHVNGNGQAYPSLARIASLTGIARNHIPRSIKRLEAAELLQHQHQRREDGAGGWDRNTYQINYDEEAPKETRAHVPKINGASPPQRRGPSEFDAQFEEFWEAYPSRGTHENPKDPACEKFAAAVRRGVDPTDIIRGAQNYQTCIRMNATDPRYVKQAVNWLNQKCWGDHQQPPEAPKPKVGLF